MSQSKLGAVKNVEIRDNFPHLRPQNLMCIPFSCIFSALKVHVASIASSFLTVVWELLQARIIWSLGQKTESTHSQRLSPNKIRSNILEMDREAVILFTNFTISYLYDVFEWCWRWPQLWNLYAVNLFNYIEKEMCRRIRNGRFHQISERSSVFQR